MLRFILQICSGSIVGEGGEGGGGGAKAILDKLCRSMVISGKLIM